MRIKHLIIFILTLGLSSIGYCSVKVAFFVHRTKNGQIQPIETGGTFYHVAIQYSNQWLHAHPFYGVQVVDNVNDIGQLYSIIEVDRDISITRFKAEFGKSFSITDSWENKKSTYCSKLIAQILEISPTLMKNGNGWGISPDDIYIDLKNQKLQENIICKNALI